MTQPALKPSSQTRSAPLPALPCAAASVSETNVPSLTEAARSEQPRSIAHGGAESPSQPNVGEVWVQPVGAGSWMNSPFLFLGGQRFLELLTGLLYVAHQDLIDTLVPYDPEAAE